MMVVKIGPLMEGKRKGTETNGQQSRRSEIPFKAL